MEISAELAQATFQFIANSRSGDAARLFLAWEDTVNAYNQMLAEELKNKQVESLPELSVEE